MIFSKKEPNRLELGGESIPYVCDIAVLEQIQTEFGDLTQVDWKLRGFIPFRDKDGNVDLSKDGRQAVPDVKVVIRSLYLMIQEGLEITGEELEITEADLKVQDELTIFELAVKTWEAFNACFLAGRRKTAKKTK